MKWLLKIFVLVFCLEPSHAKYPVLATPEDWTELFQTCETNWKKYEDDLAGVRSSLKRESDTLTEKQFWKLYDKKDPKLRFVQMHWPADFTKHDHLWAFYSRCSALNWEVRKLLSSAVAEKKEKTKAIDEFAACTKKMFHGEKPLGFPFDRLVACYRKH